MRHLRWREAAAAGPSGPTSLIVIAACHGLYVLARGIIASPDSITYAYWASRLADSGFDYAGLHAQVQGSFPPALYALFVTLLALLKLLFGPGWAAALVALNLIAHVLLGMLLVGLARRTTGSGAAAWTALLLYLGCFEVLQWVPYLLSDTTFILLAFAIFTLAARRILGVARGWWTVFAAAAAGIFYRPTGMVLLPDLAWAFYLARSKASRIPRAPLLGALFAAAAAGAIVFAWLMQDPSRWPFAPLSGAFREAARGHAIGEIVHGRPDGFHAPPATLAGYLLITGDRFLHFFAPWSGGFSRAHIALQLLFFLPCYFLAARLVLALLRGTTGLPPAARDVFFAATGAVLSYAVFHALVQVDYDWRYRLPIVPHLILLASGGAAQLTRRRGR